MSECPGSRTSSLLPAWPRDQGSWQSGFFSLHPCGFISLQKKHPVPFVVSCPAAASPPGVGSSILQRRPAEAPGFLFYSKDVETFRRRCSRSLPAYFEKYPASVEHLSVKGEEIRPRYYFLSIVLAWCGFGYYGFVK